MSSAPLTARSAPGLTYVETARRTNAAIRGRSRWHMAFARPNHAPRPSGFRERPGQSLCHP
eukprot:3382800-Pyramimonas_sp.AAC.1